MSENEMVERVAGMVKREPLVRPNDFCIRFTAERATLVTTIAPENIAYIRKALDIIEDILRIDEPAGSDAALQENSNG